MMSRDEINKRNACKHSLRIENKIINDCTGRLFGAIHSSTATKVLICKVNKRTQELTKLDLNISTGEN